LSAEVLKPFITDELRLSTTPIFFRLKSGPRAVGYDALLLPMVCKVYQTLRDSLMRKLTKGTPEEVKKAKSVYEKYEHIITRCDELAHGFSQRGILALVDDATGYQDDRVRQDIDRIIEAYVAPLFGLGRENSRTSSFGKPIGYSTGSMNRDRPSTLRIWESSSINLCLTRYRRGFLMN